MNNINEFKSEKKRYSLGYDRIDKSIEVEILGLIFNLNINEIENAKNNSENMNIDEQIERILGKNALDRINEKMLKDGHNELSASGKTTILGFLIETYTRVLSNNMVDSVTNAIGDINKNMKDFTSNNFNRSQRRYNNKYNRNNYRRY